MNTSVATYTRALANPTGSAKAAGNYENSTATKIAKGLVFICTAGIGYGIIRLIEHFGNVNPKIKEFCDNSRTIYEAIQQRDRSSNVMTVRLQCRRTLTITEGNIKTSDGRKSFVQLSLDGQVGEKMLDMTFESVLTNLREDYERHPELYGFVHGPVEDRASAFVKPDPATLSPATIAALNQIKNELFVIPLCNKTDLSVYMYSAYETFTRRVDEPIELDHLDVMFQSVVDNLGADDELQERAVEGVSASSEPDDVNDLAAETADHMALPDDIDSMDLQNFKFLLNAIAGEIDDIELSETDSEDNPTVDQDDPEVELSDNETDLP